MKLLPVKTWVILLLFLTFSVKVFAQVVGNPPPPGEGDGCESLYPIFAPIADDVSACGPGPVDITLTASSSDPDVVFRWYDNNGDFKGTGSSYEVEDLYQDQEFRVTAEKQAPNGDFCESQPTFVYARVIPRPAPPSTIGANRCGEGQVTLQASGGSSYLWYRSDHTVINGETGETYSTSVPVGTTTFYVSITESGCEGDLASVTATAVEAPEQATFSQSGSANFGSDEHITLVASPEGASNYSWFKNGIEVYSSTSDNTYMPSQSGDYKVQITTTTCGELTSEEHAVVVNNHNYIVTNTIKLEGKTSIDQLNPSDPNGDFKEDLLSQQIAYFDGLGRPSEVISTQASPFKKDMVTSNHYDEIGREDKQYLSYQAEENTGIYQTDPFTEVEKFYDNTDPLPGIATDTKPYTQTVFEPSPLNRVFQQGAPGATWQPDQGHAIEYTYRANQGSEVKKWLIDTNGLPYQDDDFASNLLYVKQTQDQDQKITREYTDKKGKIVLKRNVNTNDEGVVEFLDTYYIYDDFNRLRYVLPPEASDNYTGPQDIDLLNRLAFQYKYDARGRMTHKRVPGANWQYMVYDQRDRLILTQDGRQRTDGEWSFTHYDALNRPIISGLYHDNTIESYEDMLDALDTYYADGNDNVAQPITNENALDYNQQETGDLTLDQYKGEKHIAVPNTNIITLQPGFSVKNIAGETVTIDLNPEPNTPTNNPAFPVLDECDCQVLQQTYYDNYDFNEDGTDDYSFLTNQGDASIGVSNLVRGLATGSKVKVLESGLWLTTANFYDTKGRLIQTQSDNHVGGQDIFTTLYSFHGLVKKQWHHHTSDAKRGNEDLTILTQNEYDHADRLTHVYQTIGEEAPQLLASYEYNALGQLIDKGLHEKSPGHYLQSVDYRYNIRGWLSSINKTDLSDQTVSGSNILAPADLFGMELKYEQQIANLGNSALYNGNISAISWNKNDPTINPDFSPQAYRYTYDQVNRLKQANYSVEDNGAWGPSSKYKVEGIKYDKNGNIIKLKRNGAGGTPMDDLTYAYANNNNSNQLVSVTDAQDPATGFKDGNQGEDYSYDESGNLIEDKNKGIHSIKYNHLNLPEQIKFDGSKEIRYYYDAVGTKLEKVIYNTSATETDYTAGIQYSQRTLDIIAHLEGRSKKTESGYEQHYDLKDHLGNVRLTFSDQPVVTTFAATMETGGETAAREDAYFDNVGESRQTLAYHNATAASQEDPVPNKVATLNAAKGRIKGPAKSLQVQRGDSIHIEVKASYEEHSRKPLKGADGVIAATVGALSPSQIGMEASSAQKALSELLSGITLLDDDEDGVPKAFLNYLVMDTAMQVIDRGFVQVSQAAEVGKNSQRTSKTTTATSAPQAEHEILSVDLNIKESGYLYTYVSNESNWDVDVYFDNMEVQAASEQPTVVQSDDYYPFGLTHNQSAGRELSNKYLYNGKELQDELGLGIYDSKWREYDPALGRTWQQDPQADNYYDWSSYNWTGNNPVLNIDPDGRDVIQIAGGWKLTESDAREFFSYLQNSTNQNSSNDELPESGKGYNGKPKEKYFHSDDQEIIESTFNYFNYLTNNEETDGDISAVFDFNYYMRKSEFEYWWDKNFNNETSRYKISNAYTYTGQGIVINRGKINIGGEEVEVGLYIAAAHNGFHKYKWTHYFYYSTESTYDDSKASLYYLNFRQLDPKTKATKSNSYNLKLIFNNYAQRQRFINTYLNF